MEIDFDDATSPTAGEAARDAALDLLYRHVEDDCEWCEAIRALRAVVHTPHPTSEVPF